MERIVHSLLEPAVTPEKGEVSALEASSMTLRAELSCSEWEPEECAPAWWLVAPAGLGSPDAFGEPAMLGAAASPFSTFCWCADAAPVWLIANSANEAIAIRQMTNEASRRMRANGNSTQLD